MKIRFKKLHPDAKIPSYAHAGDAGMDLFTVEKKTLAPGERYAFKTGIAHEYPAGYVGLIWDKSGLAAREGITTMAGVTDSTYRGELLVLVVNLSDKPYTFEKGDKVAQLLLQPVEEATIEEAEELSDTTRGEGAFGSTGKQ